MVLLLLLLFQPLLLLIVSLLELLQLLLLLLLELLLPLVGLWLFPPRIVLLKLLALLDLLLFDFLTLLVLLVPQILKFLLVLLLELRIVVVAAGPRGWRTVVISPRVPRVCRSVPGPAALIRLACNVRRRRSIGVVRPGHRRILCRRRAIGVPLLHIRPVHWGVLCRTLPDGWRHLDVWTSCLNVLRLCPSHF